MPDHAHLLVEGLTQEARLPTFVQRAKLLSGYHGKQVLGDQVWQEGREQR